MIDTEKLYIVHYCHQDCMPFRNIMRLPKADAFALAREMSESNCGTAFGRFSDFENYYPLRLEADEHLYDTFITLGGKPKERHPLSFVLQGSEYLNGWFDKGTVTSILLKDIPSEYISFTYGDSTATFDRIGMVSIITKEMLLDSIREYEGTIEEYMDEIVRKHYYIEVQLWNDDYCGDCL